MMLNKKSSRMSAWKALYVLPLVGISLAATAETKVDYQYEDQESRKARILAEAKVNDTPDDKDSKKSFKEKNMMGGRFIIDEDAKSVTMIYFDHQGNEMRSTILGLDLNNMDLYFVNGNMSTPRAFEMRMEEEDVVLLTGYLRFWFTHFENSFASPPLNVGFWPASWKGTLSFISTYLLSLVVLYFLPFIW